MKRSNSYFAYLLLAMFLLSSLWFRSVTYNNAVASNSLKYFEKTNKISSQYYEECPEVPFIFIPSYSFFNFAATEELFGLLIGVDVGDLLTIFSQPLFFKNDFVAKRALCPPIYLQVQSIRC